MDQDSSFAGASDSSTSPSNPEVLNKYQAAADIANRSLAYAVGLIQPGVKPSQLCRQVDEHINQLASKIYNNKSKLTKGIAFPCAISVNNVLCHYAPLESEDSNEAFKKGDLVKVELGAHIDGFPALVAQSLVVGATEQDPVTGTAANTLQAAHLAAEAALRLVRKGNKSTDVRKPLNDIATSFETKFIEGMISHSVGKDTLAGGKALVLNPTDAQLKSLEEYPFEDYDVFVIDIAVSSGEGKVKTGNARTTIYCKTGNQYALKLKTSRSVFSEIQTKFGEMAFNIRSLDDQVRSRMALNECSSHNLVNPYEVLYERDDAITARFMITTILMPAGPLKITNYQFNQAAIKPTHSISANPELTALLDAPVRPAKKNKKPVKP